MAALNCCELKVSTETALGETVTEPLDGGLIVTWADADFVESATEVAVTDTLAGLGTEFGATYNPLVEMEPTVAVPPVVPFTAQVTLVLLVPVTVALKG